MTTAGTDDLLVSQVIRTGELQARFLAEHLVDTPLVRARLAAGTAPAARHLRSPTTRRRPKVVGPGAARRERMMDLRQMEVVVAVADTGGFTAAARRLHVVQSAVSGTGALERELGTPLFDRTTHRVA